MTINAEIKSEIQKELAKLDIVSKRLRRLEATIDLIGATLRDETMSIEQRHDLVKRFIVIVAVT